MIISMDKYSFNILGCLYKNGPLTRTELMRLLKMRQNSIVEVCDKLEEERLILKEDASRQRNVALRLNISKFACLGVEHAPDHIQMVLLDADRRKRFSTTVSLPPDLPSGARLERIIGEIKLFLGKHPSFRVTAMGFADAGIVDMEHGTGVFSAHLPDWKNIPIAKRMEAEFSVPCKVIDRLDAVCREDLMMLRVADVPNRSQLLVMAGEGIGVSIFHNGDFWSRSFSFSGQLGHTVVRPGGDICHCGNRGCLETVSGFSAILKRISLLTGAVPSDIDEVIRLEKSGNRHIQLVLREAGETLGIALANMVNITGITRIIVLSCLWHPDSAFFEAANRELKKNALYPFSEKLFLSGKLPDPEASATGAALFAQYESFLTFPGASLSGCTSRW